MRWPSAFNRAAASCHTLKTYSRKMILWFSLLRRVRWKPVQNMGNRPLRCSQAPAQSASGWRLNVVMRSAGKPFGSSENSKDLRRGKCVSEVTCFQVFFMCMCVNLYLCLCNKTTHTETNTSKALLPRCEHAEVITQRIILTLSHLIRSLTDTHTHTRTKLKHL